MHVVAPEVDDGILPWTVQPETLNQLVVGSSPTRLTIQLRTPKMESRAGWRGSVALGRSMIRNRPVQMHVIS